MIIAGEGGFSAGKVSLPLVHLLAMMPQYQSPSRADGKDEVMLRKILPLFLLLCLFAAPVAHAASPDLPPQAYMATAKQTFYYFSPEILAQNQKEKKLIRVGWFDLSGIFQKRQGEMAGYAADLLQAVSAYTGWQYEWIHTTIADLPAKLASGEIDLVCGISYSPEREAAFDYTSLPVGYECLTLHVAANSPIRFMDFRDFDQMRVGTVRGAYGGKVIEEFTRQYQFTFRPYTFSTKKEMQEALRRGEIDGYIDGSLHGDNAKIAAIIAMEPFFFVTAKGSPLLPPLNEALKQLNLYSPWLLASLFDGYMHGIQQVSFSQTRAEEEWLADKPRLRVAYSEQQAMMNDHMPGSNFLIRFMEELSRRSGIAFDYVSAPSYPEALALLKEGKADIISNIFAGLGMYASQPLLVSRPFFDMPVLLVGQAKAVPGRRIRVGVTHELLSFGQAYMAAYPEDTVTFYDSMQQCQDAFKRQAIDAYIPGYPNASGVMPVNPPNASMLTTRARYPMSLGFRYDISPYAMSVLNRSIMTMSTADIDALLLERTTPTPGALLLDILREYSLELCIGGIILFAVIILRVLHVNRRHMRELEEVAYRDPLTGGNNRARFIHDAHKLLSHTQAPHYLLLVNVRRLKLINRTRGHRGGDMLIKLCYRDLRKQLRNNELIAHASAGKFLLLWQCRDVAELRQRIEDFFESAAALRQKLGTTVLFSCGVTSTMPYDGNMANCLLRAETAESSVADDSYRSSYTLYDARLEAVLLKQNELEDRMTGALRNGEFQVFMQPQHNLADNSLHGAEALIRWIPPDGKPIYPDEFIPLFERNGFIRELDLFVLRTVCAWLRQRMDAGLPVSTVSINQSKALFFSNDYVKVFLSILASFNVPTSLIVVEITESMAWLDEELFKNSLAELKACGVRLALDDFGKGYASLAALQSFELDIIKLDKAFLDNAASDEAAADVIIGSVISMGKRLHLFMLCEGIETPEQRDYLTRVGCDCGQGYLFARPMPLEEYSLYVDAHATRPDSEAKTS